MKTCWGGVGRGASCTLEDCEVRCVFADGLHLHRWCPDPAPEVGREGEHDNKEAEGREDGGGEYEGLRVMLGSALEATVVTTILGCWLFNKRRRVRRKILKITS